ncbi:MAG TPA: hypothetical protein VLI92_03390, partial [Candidatus Saccharimonadales bacterium]|nr:hypothetical protein [Candidatus Saccharimonadales bacterium]
MGSSKTFAQEQFETQYDIQYKVGSDGQTSVQQNISIINKQKDVLATTYVLTVKQMEIYDVSAEDRKGTIETDVKTSSNETTVRVTLRNQAIGLGKQNDISLFYKSKQIASKIGEIWNINIPPVEASDSTSKYNVSLTIPHEFGPKIYISPNVGST